MHFCHFGNRCRGFYALPRVLRFVLLTAPRRLAAFLRKSIMTGVRTKTFLNTHDDSEAESSCISALGGCVDGVTSGGGVYCILANSSFSFCLGSPRRPGLFTISGGFTGRDLVSPVVTVLIPVSTHQVRFNGGIGFTCVLSRVAAFQIGGFRTVPSIRHRCKISFLVVARSDDGVRDACSTRSETSVRSGYTGLFVNQAGSVGTLRGSPGCFNGRRGRGGDCDGNSDSNGRGDDVAIDARGRRVCSTGIFTRLGRKRFVLSTNRSGMERLGAQFGGFRLRRGPLPVVRLASRGRIVRGFRRMNQSIRQVLVRVYKGKD